MNRKEKKSVLDMLLSDPRGNFCTYSETGLKFFSIAFSFLKTTRLNGGSRGFQQTNREFKNNVKKWVLIYNFLSYLEFSKSLFRVQL